MRYLPLLLLWVIVSASAQTVYEGKVVKIADGDTLTPLVGEEQHRVHLSDLDTFQSGGTAI